MALITGRLQTGKHFFYVLASFLLVCMPGSLLASEWKVIADTTLGQIRMDASTVAKTEGYTKAWFTYDFKKTQRLAEPINTIFSLRKDLVYINCATQTLGIGQSDFFDEDHLVYSKEIEMVNVKFTTVAPDTMAEKLLDALCVENAAK